MKFACGSIHISAGFSAIRSFFNFFDTKVHDIIAWIHLEIYLLRYYVYLTALSMQRWPRRRVDILMNDLFQVRHLLLIVLWRDRVLSKLRLACSVLISKSHSEGGACTLIDIYSIKLFIREFLDPNCIESILIRGKFIIKVLDYRWPFDFSLVLIIVIYCSLSNFGGSYNRIQLVFFSVFGNLWVMKIILSWLVKRCRRLHLIIISQR